MNNMSSNGLKRIFPYVVFFIVVGGFYILNAAIPLFADDMPYGYYFPDHIVTDYSERFAREFTSVWDIFESQWNHYFYQNGRCVAHFFVQLFCWGDHKDIYNVFATVLFAFYVLAFGKLCFPAQQVRQNIVTSVACFGLLLFYLEEPNILYNGIAFGCGYLYSGAVWMVFVYLLCHRRTSERWRNVVLIGMAVFAGWSNESLSVSFSAATLVWAYLNRETLQKSEYIALALCCIATVVMVLAPGNFLRADSPRSYWGMIRPGIDNYWLIVLVVLWYLLYRKYPEKIKILVRENIPLLSGIVVAALFLSYIGWCDGRPRYGFQLLVFILYARLFTTLQWNRLIQGLKYIGVTMAVFGLSSIIYYQIPAGREYRCLYAACENPKNDTVVFQFSGAEVPAVLSRHICSHTFSTTYWDDKYSMKYKKPVYITDAKLVNYAYPSIDKLPGNNPFYKIGDFWISKEKLPENVNVKVEQGKYQLWDMPTLLRRCYNAVKTIPATSMSFSLKSDSICIGKDKYVYYVQQTEKTPREMVQIDMLPN